MGSNEIGTYQMMNLKEFRVPKHFRGRSPLIVLLWDLVNRLLFKPSPKVAYGWRRFLLRRFGATIGRGVLIRPSVSITYPWKLYIGEYSWVGDNTTLYTLGDIRIGCNTVISQHTYVCTGTHEFGSQNFDIIAQPITIGKGSWVAYGSFIAPGVTIGDNCFIKAMSKVTKNICDNQKTR